MDPSVKIEWSISKYLFHYKFCDNCSKSVVFKQFRRAFSIIHCVCDARARMSMKSFISMKLVKSEKLSNSHTPWNLSFQQSRQQRPAADSRHSASAASLLDIHTVLHFPELPTLRPPSNPTMRDLISSARRMIKENGGVEFIIVLYFQNCWFVSPRTEKAFFLKGFFLGNACS